MNPYPGSKGGFQSPSTQPTKPIADSMGNGNWLAPGSPGSRENPIEGGWNGGPANPGPAPYVAPAGMSSGQNSPQSFYDSQAASTQSYMHAPGSAGYEAANAAEQASNDRFAQAGITDPWGFALSHANQNSTPYTGQPSTPPPAVTLPTTPQMAVDPSYTQPAPAPIQPAVASPYTNVTDKSAPAQATTEPTGGSGTGYSATPSVYSPEYSAPVMSSSGGVQPSKSPYYGGGGGSYANNPVVQAMMRKRRFY